MKENAGYFIKKISNKMEASWNAALKSMNVTGTQLHVMEYIYHNPEKSLTADISEFFGVKHTSTLHVLRALEKKQYIYHEEAEKGRGRPIRLTEQGIALVKHNESGAELFIQTMFAGMDDKDKQTLLCLLKQVDHNLEEL